MTTMQVTGMGLMQEKKFGCTKMYRQDVHGKDHMRENLRRLRQIQRATKAREHEAQKPVKALWQSEKYKDVQSKVRVELDKAPPTPRPESANYLRCHSRTGPPASRPPSPMRAPTPELSVPTACSAQDIHIERRNVNFIKLNGRVAGQSRPTKSPSLTALDDIKIKDDQQMAAYQPGVVPRYLKDRKEKWRQDEEYRIANTPDPTMPEGHRAMPDNERQDTLQLLLANQKLLMKELQSLPLTTDTLRVKKRKQEVENKLGEIDEAVKIFSRPKVFVKIDS